MTSFGFHPSQPVSSVGDLDRVPELLRQRGCERIPIGFDVREHDEAHDEERKREPREPDDDDGPEKAGQREAERAGSAKEGAHGRHNGAASAL